MLTLTHVLDFFPPNFEELKLFLISETPCSSRIIPFVTFSRFSCYWGYRNFRWFFQVALHKASQGSKAHGLQLKGGNCFIRAPALLACTTKEKGTCWELSQPCIDKPSFASLPEKSSFQGVALCQPPKKGLPSSSQATSRQDTSTLLLLRVYRIKHHKPARSKYISEIFSSPTNC